MDAPQAISAALCMGGASEGLLLSLLVAGRGKRKAYSKESLGATMTGEQMSALGVSPAQRV